MHLRGCIGYLSSPRGYWARTLGRAFLLRWGRWVLINPDKYHEAEELFLRNARIATFVGRFLPVIRHLMDGMRSAVETLKPIEREISKVQKKLETLPAARAENVKDLRKEQRSLGQQLQQLEERFGASAAVPLNPVTRTLLNETLPESFAMKSW